MLAILLLMASTTDFGIAPHNPAMRIGPSSDPTPTRRAPMRIKRQRDRIDPYIMARSRWQADRDDCLRRKNRDVTSCLMPKPVASDYLKMPRP